MIDVEDMPGIAELNAVLDEGVENADRADTMDAPMRHCVGSMRYGIDAHDDLAEHFPVQPSGKDGLGRMCKPHWRTYVSGLAADAKARKSATLTPAQEAEIAERQAETGDAPVDTSMAAGIGRLRAALNGDEPKPKRGRAPRAQAEVVASIAKTAKAAGAKVRVGRVPKATADALAAQRAEHVALERELLAVGGSGTDAGQAILEAAATKAAAGRTSRTGAKAIEPVEQEGAAE